MFARFLHRIGLLHRPNGDGRIAFRWRSDPLAWTSELDADGSMETSLMEYNHLVCRDNLHGEPTR